MTVRGALILNRWLLRRSFAVVVASCVIRTVSSRNLSSTINCGLWRISLALETTNPQSREGEVSSVLRHYCCSTQTVRPVRDSFQKMFTGPVVLQRATTCGQLRADVYPSPDAVARALILLNPLLASFLQLLRRRNETVTEPRLGSRCVFSGFPKQNKRQSE